MRLVAVFIKGHFLFEEDQIINFGGEYIYDFKTIKDNILYYQAHKLSLDQKKAEILEIVESF